MGTATFQGVATITEVSPLDVGTDPSDPDYMFYDAYANTQGLLLFKGEGAENRTETLPLRPPQQDTGANPNEIPSALGRYFAQSDFSHGAGQFNFHIAGVSDISKYRHSEGYDISDLGYLKHLNAVTVNANLGALTAGSSGRFTQTNSQAFICDGTNLKRFSTPSGSPTTEDPHAGEGAVTVEDVTSEGDRLFVALGVNGIHLRDGAGTWTHYNDAAAIRVAFLKDRLCACTATIFYEITASGAAPAAKLTLKTGWTFTDIAESGAYIYATAIHVASGQSRVHRFGLDSSLNVTWQGSTIFPDNDLVYSIKGHIGSLLLVGGGRKNSSGGKDTVVYTAVPQDDGSLEYDLLMDSEGAGSRDLACRAIATWGRKFLLGWTLGATAPFGVREGLAVYDPALGSFSHHLASSTSTVTPDPVLGIGIFGGQIIFTTIDGLYYQSLTTYVSTATFISSLANFSNAGLKTWDESKFSIEALPTGTSVTLSYTTTDPEGAAWSTGPTTSTAGDTEAAARHSNVESAGLSVRIVSTSNGAQTSAPEIQSFAVRSSPTLEQAELKLIRTFRIFDRDRAAGRNQEVRQNPRTIRNTVRNLYLSTFNYYEADANYNVRMTAFQEQADAVYTDKDGNAHEEGYLITAVLEGVQN